MNIRHRFENLAYLYALIRKILTELMGAMMWGFMEPVQGA